MKVFLYIIGWTSAILLLMQLVKIEIPTPPKAAPADEIVASKEVMTILKKACYDCHS
ncbi:MAG TPA: cytochrome C, partial [Sulfurovum sp.]|nr:cytochrome C [Sulfurovum sp.]